MAGVDEVGRGCFAGPVVAAACAFAPMNNPLRGKNLELKMNNPLRGKNFRVIIDDSKKLTPRQREKSAEWIKENALTWGIGRCLPV